MSLPLMAEKLQVDEAGTGAGRAQPQDAVLSAVREASEPTRVYWAMNALATVIACYGLFANSPAVVIGAMVVGMPAGPHFRRGPG